MMRRDLTMIRSRDRTARWLSVEAEDRRTLLRYVDEIENNDADSTRQAVAALDELGDGPEESHLAAERILIEYLRATGADAVADAFERAKNRNGFWYA